ncbi:hypothetical protein [Clostridium beijerinckii]|uniref:hypothetical protein n=1 Tax=Clostridium beijerinckii TaxID=1520 RepID=UPI0015C56A28|nr:hypothetical protein [Clostridium beijerinckii]
MIIKFIRDYDEDKWRLAARTTITLLYLKIKIGLFKEEYKDANFIKDSIKISFRN